MPQLKTYDLFLSHAWFYSEGYRKFFDLIAEAPNFRFRNYSVPQHDPLIDPNTKIGKARLIQMLDDQIRPVNCFLVMSGMYAAYKDWIQIEIDIARKYNKPIVGLIPWGQQRVPENVQVVAHELVRWNTISMVDAIRRVSI